MPDHYPNFATLSQHEAYGIDFRVHWSRAQPAFVIVAPHGGGIEPGTSELAEAIAGMCRSFYAFEGLKESGNAALHITSTRFDEPMCNALIEASDTVVTIHGECSGDGVFVGGLDEALGHEIGSALEANGFDVCPASSHLQGSEPDNLCNRGRLARGVQLELSHGLRKTMFRSLTREGRKDRNERFEAFVAAVSAALD
jgi:phage replication-related protein YjqB (UPF0714/DUF867 family)